MNNKTPSESIMDDMVELFMLLAEIDGQETFITLSHPL